MQEGILGEIKVEHYIQSSNRVQTHTVGRIYAVFSLNSH